MKAWLLSAAILFELGGASGAPPRPPTRVFRGGEVNSPPLIERVRFAAPGGVNPAPLDALRAANRAQDDVTARAARLHRDAIVVDSHEDVPDALAGKWADLAVEGATKHFDIPRAKRGGLTAPFFAVYVPASYADAGAARVALDRIDMVQRVVAAHPDDLVAGSSVADVRRAKREGRIAVLMGIEGGHAIEDSLGALRDFHRLGVRYMTLTHTNSNHWADSAGNFFAPRFDPESYRLHHGLTGFGRAVVREMNRIGMMVDVSHVSDETIDDVLETSRAPVFASHSSCRALSALPRNLTDDQIRRIAARSGVVMINVSSVFLDQATVEAARARLDALQESADRIRRQYEGDPRRAQAEIDKLADALPHPAVPLARVVDHIEHAMKIAGPDAVGLGTDFDGMSDPPAGLEDVSRLPRITEELLRRGHSEDEVRNVLGESFLRFFARVEEVSRSLQAEPPATDVLTTSSHDGGDAMTLTLTSSAFSHGGEIPTVHTCEGSDTSPALSWSGVPARAKSLALIMDDPDAPDPKAPRMTYVHWVLYDIPPRATGLAEGAAQGGLPTGTREGTNDWKRTGYGGPCPPIGRHRYFHKLYALDTELPDLGSPTKAQLEKAIEGHVVEKAELMGTYEKKKK
ncbi:MAG: hypothetical protein DMF80_14495 [Acidobacteria bacterium]|nr:MAG: hypothetical protein DMF80_14495 [Acidobacteriota bacterium]